MNQIGPFPLPTVIVMASLIIGSITPIIFFRRQGLGKSAAGLVFDAFLVALVVARLAYIIKWWAEYSNAPLSIFSIGDGGWYWWLGIPAGLVFLLWRTRNKTKLIRPAAVGIITAALVWLFAQAILDVVNSEQHLPELTLPALDERYVSLDEYQGKPMAINLWATWCPPCRREMPAFAAAESKHQNINFILINQGETKKQIEKFLNQQGLKFNNILLDKNNELMRAMQTSVLPTTLFFDKTGRLIKLHQGELTSARIKDLIEQLF